MIKVIIAGGRDFKDYDLLKEKLDYYLSNLENIIIVSGGASGADSLGERYAKEKGYSLVTFQADWNKYGKSAGPIRNRQMANYADHLVAFWDGKSRGTLNMINTAKELALKIKIIKI